MFLKIRHAAIATAYVAVPIGSFSKELALARSSLQNWLRTASSTPEGGIDPLYVLGQADLAVQVRVSDFTKVLDIDYPGAELKASTANWVYSLPYDVPSLARPDRTGVAGFRFLLHLRLRRDVFAYPGAETKIVETIVSLPRTHLSLHEVQLGLGWSDLIIEGGFSRESYSEFVRFVLTIHALQLTVQGKPLPVLQRMLTIIGYHPDYPPAAEPLQHMTFVRILPSTYNRVAKLLASLGGDVHILDGKADFVVIAPQVQDGFLGLQRALAEDGSGIGAIQKLETHLLFSPAEALQGEAQALAASVSNETTILHEPCRCATTHDEWRKELADEIAKLRTNLLPAQYYHAIQNVTFLLGATLRDASICCDTRSAVRGCYEGIVALVRDLKELSERAIVVTHTPHAGLLPVTIASDEDVYSGDRKKQEFIVASYRRIDAWHRFVELVLRQRTVGSFEEILGQTDRAVVYSGGFQKFLYLADCLINDFAQKVDPNAPTFATIYDSVKTVLSVLGIGLVRVPTRKIFRLPLVVPDLWHEVGVYFFFRRGFSDMVGVRNDFNQFVANLHDHYADLLVYLYGFNGDLLKFVASLASGWVEAWGDTTEGVQTYSIHQLLLRIYLVTEFEYVRKMRFDHEVFAKRQKDPSDFILDRVNEVREQMKAFGRGRYAVLSVPQSYWLRLRKNVLSEDFAYHRELYRGLVDHEVRATSPNVFRFEKGEIQPFGDDEDLNDYFGQLAYSIQMPNRSTDIEDFLIMATMGKSASTEYHRRQMQQRAPGARPTSSR